MAYRESLAWCGVCLGAIGTVVWALMTWGGLDLRETGYEWIGAAIGIGVLLFLILVGVTALDADPQDERERLIGLKAERVAWRACIVGLAALHILGTLSGPLPAGAPFTLLMAAITAMIAAQLWYYRRGV